MNSQQQQNLEGPRQLKKNERQSLQLAKMPTNSSKFIREDDQSDMNFEDTITKPLLVPKICVDDEATNKFNWKNNVDSIANVDKKTVLKDFSVIKQKQKQVSEQESNTFEIPYNKKVDEIMSKKPLRERLAGMMPAELLLPISFDHQQLLKRMSIIDRTIDFLGVHRGQKIIFFEALRKNISESAATSIEIKTILQLMYLDENSYHLEWKMNEKIKRFDLKITLPEIESMDLRKADMRKKIVKFLLIQEAELLTQLNEVKVDMNKWHSKFDISKVAIPQKNLPVHPNSLSSDLRAFPNSQIEKIQNKALQKLFKTKKENAEVRSMSGASVADMIFSKKSSNEISAHIMEMVREKQRKNLEEAEKKMEVGEVVDKVAMQKICEELLMIFMSKNVSNIFKATLIEMLQKRMAFKDHLIIEYLDKILNIPDVAFLKEIESSQKLKVIQINRQKYKSVREYIEEKY